MNTFNEKTIEYLADYLEHGLLYISSDGIIRMCNQSAKDITGITINSAFGHNSGTIEQGDIVVIADNMLGEDDGNLTVEDLKTINIHDKKISKGDTLIAVGSYMSSDISPEYKFLREHSLDRNVSIRTNFFGFNISATIDTLSRKITISVNDVDYALDYYKSVGHMVVICGKTGIVKFFQMKGYSTRHEEIALLLRGKSFLQKSAEDNNIQVTGHHYLKFFDKTRFSDELFTILKGKSEGVDNIFCYINKRPLLCSILPWKASEKIDGAFLLMQDAGNLDVFIERRNEIIQKLEKQNKESGDRLYDYPEDALTCFSGTGAKAREVKYMAYKASQNNYNVIITGESGTGKSTLARAIHKMGAPDTPFVEVNCNAIAPSLFESELFGYVPGAFTGALKHGKQGLFEAANGGTIFLDEIGELPLNIQVKLLHVLQNKTIYKVGSSTPITVNVRVITATNTDLSALVANGKFRQDLFYRINVFPISIPPLRERTEDLYLLITQILKSVCVEYQMEEKQFSGEALKKLISYSWPGNVRELENTIERAVSLCESNVIYSEHLKLNGHTHSLTMKHQLEEEEKRIIVATLAKHMGNKNAAMCELEMSKSVFYSKLKKHGI